MKKLVTISEAAEATGLSKYALTVGAKRGDFPYIKIGTGRGRIFFDIDLLAEAIQLQAKKNAAKNAELYEGYLQEHYPITVYKSKG